MSENGNGQMPKRYPKTTEQVRIPCTLAHDGRVIASAFGQSLPEYLTEVLTKAVRRDMVKVGQMIEVKLADRKRLEEKAAAV